MQFVEFEGMLGLAMYFSTLDEFANKCQRFAANTTLQHQYMTRSHFSTTSFGFTRGVELYRPLKQTLSLFEVQILLKEIL